VSYNLDTTSGWIATENNIHEYQPQFLQLDIGT
jgi:hypothetical protein